MSALVCDVCTRASATKICLCVYPCTRLCDQDIPKHCGLTNSGHSLEPVAALSLIKSRSDIPAFFARQQLFQEVADALSANLASFRGFRTEVESLFVQIDTYRMSKLAEISAAERALEATVNTCLAQLESLRYAQLPQARNRFEFILSQGTSLNLTEVRKELTMFGATFGQPGQWLSGLDAAIRVVVAPGVHTRPAGQVLSPPQLPCATVSGGEAANLQRALSELRMELAGKDQTLATVKNNRDELKEQYAAKRQEYERTIRDLEMRVKAGGAGGSVSNQDTIQDLKDERHRLISEKKQYEEALRHLKVEKSALMEKLGQSEAQKEKIEKDAMMMAMMLRDKLPQMERQLKEASAEKDSLIELRNRLERLFGNLPMINIGCNEGQVMVQAQRLIRAQKTGEGDGMPGFIRFVVI